MLVLGRGVPAAPERASGYSYEGHFVAPPPSEWFGDSRESMVQDPLLEGSLALLRKCKVQDPLLEGSLGLFKKCKVQDPLLEEGGLACKHYNSRKSKKSIIFHTLLESFPL